MSSPIGMIAPTAEIAERAQRVARDLEMSDQISFHVANLQEGVEVARELERNGVEVLIGRRGTAELIRKNLATPLVPVPVSVQDMARALREAKLLTGRERPRIAFFALPSAQADLEVFREFMEIDLHIYNMVAEEEYLEWMVDRAIADKMHVIVAGSVGHHAGQPAQLSECSAGFRAAGPAHGSGGRASGGLCPHAGENPGRAVPHGGDQLPRGHLDA